MVLKYNLVIAILISLLLLMLYLGNYNLIEGNTSSQVMANLDSLVENSRNKAKVLQNNRPYNSGCASNETMNKKNSDIISQMGGAQSSEAQTVHGANQTLATLCSKNDKLGV
jgi:hypothetical protein